MKSSLGGNPPPAPAGKGRAREKAPLSRRSEGRWHFACLTKTLRVIPPGLWLEKKL
jgi:hypothetical protein